MNWEVDAEGVKERERRRRRRGKGGCTADDVGRREKRRVEHCQSRTFSQNSVMAEKNREGWSVRSGGADVPRSGSYSGRVYREEEKKRKEAEKQMKRMSQRGC